MSNNIYKNQASDESYLAFLSFQITFNILSTSFDGEIWNEKRSTDL